MSQIPSPTPTCISVSVIWRFCVRFVKGQLLYFYKFAECKALREEWIIGLTFTLASLFWIFNTLSVIGLTFTLASWFWIFNTLSVIGLTFTLASLFWIFNTLSVIGLTYAQG